MKKLYSLLSVIFMGLLLVAWKLYFIGLLVDFPYSLEWVVYLFIVPLGYNIGFLLQPHSENKLNYSTFIVALITSVLISIAFSGEYWIEKTIATLVGAVALKLLIVLFDRKKYNS